MKMLLRSEPSRSPGAETTLLLFFCHVSYKHAAGRIGGLPPWLTGFSTNVAVSSTAAPNLTVLLCSAGQRRSPALCRQLHAQLLKSDLHHLPPFPVILLTAYIRCDLLPAARHLIYGDHIEHKFLAFYSDLWGIDEDRMPSSTVAPHLAVLLCSARQRRSPALCHQLHTQLLKSGLHRLPPFLVVLLTAYARCGLLPAAHHLFDKTLHRDPFL